MNRRRPGAIVSMVRRAAIVAVPVVSLWASEVGAQDLDSTTAAVSAPSDSTQVGPTAEETQARLFFEAAKLAYDSEQYAQAADLFERVYDLSPHPFMLINLASAYRHLEDPAREAEALQRYLQTSGSEADPTYVQRFQQLVDALAATLPRRDRRKLLRLEASVLEDLPPMADTPVESLSPNQPTADSRAAPRAPSLWHRYRTAWLLLGGSVALSGSALALWGSTRSKYDSLMRECRDEAGCDSSQVDGVASRTRATRTLATLALVSTATTATLFAWPVPRESRRRASRSPTHLARTRLAWRGATLTLQSEWR